MAWRQNWRDIVVGYDGVDGEPNIWEAATAPFVPELGGVVSHGDQADHGDKDHPEG
jgi:hypothetical protein